MAPIGLLRLISHNGGWIKSILTLCRREDLKLGQLVGKDRLGNSYYENNYYFFGTNRWVAYSDRYGYDYDATCIDSQWFRWVHYMTDIPPNEEENRSCYKWMLMHTENYTGTKDEYVPYSTTPPKIVPWIPPKKPTKPCLLKK